MFVGDLSVVGLQMLVYPQYSVLVVVACLCFTSFLMLVCLGVGGDSS